jgi:hypothetical protein
VRSGGTRPAPGTRLGWRRSPARTAYSESGSPSRCAPGARAPAIITTSPRGPRLSLAAPLSDRRVPAPPVLQHRQPGGKRERHATSTGHPRESGPPPAAASSHSAAARRSARALSVRTPRSSTSGAPAPGLPDRPVPSVVEQRRRDGDAGGRDGASATAGDAGTGGHPSDDAGSRAPPWPSIWSVPEPALRVCSSCVTGPRRGLANPAVIC